MPGLVNVKAWTDEIRAKKRAAHQTANQIVRARVVEVFEEALRVSPQWSGNYAANWVIETNINGISSPTSALKVTPWKDLEWWDIGKAAKIPKKPSGKPFAKSSGDKIAINLAKSRGSYETVFGYGKDGNMFKEGTGNGIDSVKWNSTVRLVNRTDTADVLATGTQNLRNVNLVAGKKGVLTYLKSKYSYLI